MESKGVLMSELLDCLANGRDPTIHELHVVARGIWTQGAADRSAFMWDRMNPVSQDRAQALRAALAALRGSDAGS